MAFNVAAGIAQMGESVAKISGLAALEQQKSGLENERLKLANDLAMQRESVGRKEAHGLDMEKLEKSQTFQAAEGDKTRATQLEASRISAGASMANAGTHLQAVREQIAASEKLGDFRYNEDGTASMVNKRSGVATPVLGEDGQPKKFSNPDKAKAQAAMIETTKDQLNSTIRVYEADLKQAQAAYKAATDSIGGKMDPTKDPGVLEAKKEIEAVRQKYEPKITTLTSRLDQIYTDLGVKAGMATQKPGGYDLNKYMKGGGNTPAAPSAPSAPRGILSNPDNF